MTATVGAGRRGGATEAARRLGVVHPIVQGPYRWTRELGARPDLLPPFPVLRWFASQLRPAALAAGAAEVVSPWGGQIAPDLRHRDAAASSIRSSICRYQKFLF